MAADDDELAVPRPRDEAERAALRRLADDGDAAAIARHLLDEGRTFPLRPGLDADRVLGRTDDLLGQDHGDPLVLIGWIAALANGVVSADGIEQWASAALTDAALDAAARPVLWSEIGAGDLVVCRTGGEVRAAVALDAIWGVHLGATGLARIALVDLVADGDGPFVLRDKLWFWGSYGAVEEPEHLRREPVAASHAPLARPAPRSLLIIATMLVAVLSMVLGAVIIGGRERPAAPPVVRRSGLFPLDQLVLRSSTIGGTDLHWCLDGVPVEPYAGEALGIRIRRVDVYGFDDDTLLVDVTFLEPLDETLDGRTLRAVRGYALDDAGLAQGLVQHVEVTATGREVRGQLTLSGVPVPGSASTVAVGDGFQFFLATSTLADADRLVIGVDSIGGAPGESGALPCHLVVTEPVDAS